MAASVRPPLPALLLGAAGLLPPIAAAIGLFVLPAGAAQQFDWVALVFYGALIFSFLGGTWWAFASAGGPSWSRMVMAVMPSLLALFLLLLVLGAETRSAAAGLLALAVLVSPIADASLHAAGLTPAWWMRLRLPLSAVLAACLALAAWRAPLG